MRPSRSFTGALTLFVAAFAFAGCSNGNAPAVPAPNPGQMTRHGSWIDPTAASGALLYVSDPAAKGLHIYSYPDLRMVGNIVGLRDAEGLCVDSRTGSVWVTLPSFHKVVEFPHGGVSPIRTLKNDYLPLSACAVDQSGDVAADAPLSGSDPGAMVVFKNGRGKPEYYQSRRIIMYGFVGYDDSGNAFVDGGGEDLFHFELAELPAGQSKLKNVTPHHLTIHRQGGVQYDGTDLAVGDEKLDLIYRISNKQVVGTVQLQGACLIRDFFIDGGKLIAPSACSSNGDVLVYDYPAGGKPVRKLTGFSDPFGVVVSR
jgi:hypothetical protein